MRCPTCQQENPEAARFCAFCGAALQPVGRPTEERRLVTILFADVSGSTALGETLDPEDVRALLARFYVIAQEVIGNHGGTLEKFIGDAVMAVFGLPQAHGDDPQRALAAALELRERVRNDAKLGNRLPIRVGVNTGEVVASRGATTGDFLVTGDAVNVAARLQQSAEPWAVLCSERTALAAAREFVFGAPLRIAAKGKREAISAALLVSRGSAAGPRRVPLIGREHDLAHLELVAQRAFAERRPFLVSLVAPAGTGKTRLLEEFLDRLPRAAPGTAVAVAQCLPYGQRLTYWPLRAVLFSLIGIAEDLPPEDARRSVRAWLRDASVEGADRAADFLSATVGIGEVEVSDRDALFAAWRTLVETAAARGPLVLVFEDLHWSSDTLLDLVEFVMQPRRDVPVLMIALARPELLDRRPGWGGGRRNYVSLALEPLSDEAVRNLAVHLLGEEIPDIVTRVVERAEGNPFYAGEIVRAVMDRVPSLRDQASIEQVLAVLPDTVQTTVLARLDLLQNAERRVLQMGAVFGRAFRPAGIVALASDLSAEIGHVIDRLEQKDLIYRSDGDRWAFRHILIREVAYQTLPRTERARLHAAAARWLEVVAVGREDVLAELIAYHYREAVILDETLDVDAIQAAETRRQAVRWLSRAAEAARVAAAFVEARRHIQHAIELAEHSTLPELYERFGIVTWGDAGVQAFRKALTLCRELGRPPDQELRVLASLLLLHMRWGGTVGFRPSNEDIAALLAEGHVLLERAQDKQSIALFNIARGFHPFWLNGGYTHVDSEDLQKAEASARIGLQIAEELGDARLQSAALDGMGAIQNVRHAWRDVREVNSRRLLLQDRLDLVERTDAYSMVAEASSNLGDLEEAEHATASGLAILQPGQATLAALHLAAWRIYSLTLMGRWDDASSTFEVARRLWLEGGLASTGYAVQGFMAALDVARARRDEARVDQSRSVLEEILRNYPEGHRIQRTWAYLTLDLVMLEEDIRRFQGFGRPAGIERRLSVCVDRRHPIAIEGLKPIIDFASAHQLVVLEAQARRALGATSGDPQELTAALDLFERCHAIPYAARARCERAELTGDAAELTAGVSVLDALGDLDYLSRLPSRSGRTARA